CTDTNAVFDNCAEANPSGAPDFDSATQVCARTNVRPIFNGPLVVDARAGVDDHVLTYCARRVNHHSGADYAAGSYTYSFCDYCFGMNGRSQFKAFRSSDIGESQPCIAMSECKDKVFLTLCSKGS